MYIAADTMMQTPLRCHTCSCYPSSGECYSNRCISCSNLHNSEAHLVPLQDTIGYRIKCNLHTCGNEQLGLTVSISGDDLVCSGVKFNTNPWM